MNIKYVIFDLDGTLLPMDEEKFVKGYFGLLAVKAAPRGYDPKALTDGIMTSLIAMVKNDGSATNEAVFWKSFSDIFGEKSLDDLPLFMDFYKNEFQQASSYCGFNPEAKNTVDMIKKAGYHVGLATNPVFPSVATESRIRWAGLEPSDFEFYTTYENSSYCKPNPKYYEEILSKLPVSPEECLMVGNDVIEDMSAGALGMKLFLLTDCLINKKNEDISKYPHGSFKELQKYLNLI